MKKLTCPLCPLDINLDGLVAHMVTTHKKPEWTVSCERCKALLNSCPRPYEQHSALYAWLHINVPNHPCHQAGLRWDYSLPPASNSNDIKVIRDRCDAYRLGAAKKLPQDIPSLAPYLLVPKRTASAHTSNNQEEALLGGFDLSDPAVRKTFCLNAQIVSAWSSEYNGTTYVDLEWPRITDTFLAKPFGAAVQKWRSVINGAGLDVHRFRATVPIQQRPTGLTNCNACGPDSAHTTLNACSRWARCAKCDARFEWGYPTCECCLKHGGVPLEQWCDWCDQELDHGSVCCRPEPCYPPYTLSWIPDHLREDQEWLKGSVMSILAVQQGPFKTKRCDCANCVSLINLIEGKQWESAKACAQELIKRPNVTCPKELRRYYPIPHLHHGNPTNYETAGNKKNVKGPIVLTGTDVHRVRFPGDHQCDLESRQDVWLKVKSVNVKKKTLTTSGTVMTFTNVWGLDETFVSTYQPYVVLVCGGGATTMGWCCVLSLPGEALRNAYRQRWGSWLCPRPDFKVRLKTMPMDKLSETYVMNYIPNAAFKAYGRTVPKGWIKRNLSSKSEHVSPLLVSSNVEVQEPDMKMKTAIKKYYQTMGSEYREHRRVAKSMAVLSKTLNCSTLDVHPDNAEPFTTVAKLLTDDEPFGKPLRSDPTETDAYIVLKDYMQPADPRVPRFEPDRVEELCLKADEHRLFCEGITARAVLMYAACKHGIFPAWDLDKNQWQSLDRSLENVSLLGQTVLRYYNRFALWRCLPCPCCGAEADKCECRLSRCLLCNVGLHGPWACELLIRPSVPFVKLVVDLRSSTVPLSSSSSASSFSNNSQQSFLYSGNSQQ
ncbi:hypothetical protein [Crucian carp herpesvirus]|uniref:ORF96 n=1 Tax=Cyprinid herpesvirus 2 TaxID=317878 RepID=A0A0E3X911_CYHV2|nr:hypothetical protein [Cyprinid herpesvirus 2]AMB21665.1 ORF96 [Cyprinid herpesvirus 2]APB92943.1 hypothetical protein [Crucian carp herpesvirus]QAU54818.1 protein ORF96 [Cyprinid herpesvirus 2]QIM55264.1 hypothetical protein [Cyprinid herpesvirus 2]